LGAVLPPGDRLVRAGDRIAVERRPVAGLVLLDLPVDGRHRALLPGGGRRITRVPLPGPTAERRARGGDASTALVLDPGDLPLLGLVKGEQPLHAERVVGIEAGGRRPTSERAPLEHLLAREEVLDAELPDRALAVVLAGAAEVPLIGQRGRAVEVGA